MVNKKIMFVLVVTLVFILFILFGLTDGESHKETNLLTTFVSSTPLRSYGNTFCVKTVGQLTTQMSLINNSLEKDSITTFVQKELQQLNEVAIKNKKELLKQLNRIREETIKNCNQFEINKSLRNCEFLLNFAKNQLRNSLEYAKEHDSTDSNFKIIKKNLHKDWANYKELKQICVKLKEN